MTPKLRIFSIFPAASESGQKAVEHRVIQCFFTLLLCHCRKRFFMDTVSKERIDGFLETLEKYDPEYDRNKVIAEGDYTHPGGYRAMKELLLKVPDLDGVFCANDQSAIGALRCLSEAGKRVPQDVRVIGYDDVFISGVMDPPLSTVHIQKVHAGRKVAELLIQRIRENGIETEPGKTAKKYSWMRSLQSENPHRKRPGKTGCRRNSGKRYSRSVGCQTSV